MTKKKEEYEPIFTDEELEEGIRALVGLLPRSLLTDSMQTLGKEEGQQHHTRPLPSAENSSKTSRSSNSE